MPRVARQKSESGIYHIILRGINRQQIFEDEEDQKYFVETLIKYKDISGYKIYAYCLMGNHIHILLQEGKEDLVLILKRIAGSYVYWYNWKYHRVGHLFQDRFKSEPVEDDSYFLSVLRYIHQNPVKAKICNKAEQYKFSSYNEYLNGGTLTDTSFAFSLLSKTEFAKFHCEENTDQCLDLQEHFRLTDEDAKIIIQKITRSKSVAEFQNFESDKRNLYIKKLHENGLSIRQISRLTGLSKKIVENNI